MKKQKRKPIKPSDFFRLPVVGPFLTTRDVAALENVTPLDVSHWCRSDLIYPAERINGRWRIAPDYIVVFGARGKVYPDAPPRRGRPLGAKNKRPYPEGVKRPRKPKPQSTSPSQ